MEYKLIQPLKKSGKMQVKGTLISANDKNKHITITIKDIE